MFDYACFKFHFECILTCATFRYPEGNDQLIWAQLPPRLIDLCCSRVAQLGLLDYDDDSTKSGTKAGNFRAKSSSIPEDIREYFSENARYCTNAMCGRVFCCSDPRALTLGMLTVQWHGYLLPMRAQFCQPMCLREHCANASLITTACRTA